MQARVVRRPYAIAAASLAVGGWIAAPVTGRLRDFLLETFPGTFLKVLAAGLALVALAVGVAAARVVWRHRTRSRFFWWLAAAALLGIQLTVFAEADGSVNVVEKVHIVQYGLLAFLVARAVGASEDERDGSEGTTLSIPSEVWLAAFVAALAGLIDESVQGFFQLRTGDIRDVGLNTLSGLMGACVSAAGGTWKRQRWTPTPVERRRVGLWAALWIFGLGLFFDQAHLGYRHHDPEIGEFRSWFTAQQLDELALDRRRAWTKAPPTGLQAWGRQDYFLTEAAWHANHRNERLEARDWPLSWRANQILERHYDPFLDIESFRGSGKHRWDPSLKARVQKEVEALENASETSVFWHPSTYRSPVLSKRIYLWPRSVYLFIWLSVVLLSIAWAFGRGRKGA